MKQKPFWKPPLFLSLLLFALFTFLLAVSPRFPTSPAGSDGGQIEESKIITQNMSCQIAQRSLDDLKKESALIAVGTITGASESFQIRAVQGGFSNFIDYSFELEEVYRGDATPGDTVSIRKEGGAVGYLNVVCHDAPELVPGKQYLLFLRRPGTGGGYTARGDYYFLTDLVQGVFQPVTPGPDGTIAYSPASPVYSPVTGESIGSINPEKFAAEMAVYNKEHPYDPDAERTAFEDAVKRRLDNGTITQEGYDELLAESREYATVLEPEYGPDGKRIYPQSGKFPTYKKDMDVLKQESSLVALGTVTEIQNTLQIESTKDIVSNFTDYSFRLEEVYRGEWKAGDTVTVRKEGGVAGDRRVEAHKAPDFQEGDRMVLFLYQPNMGGDFNTEGDYYFITGAYQGIFKPEALSRSGAAAYSSDAETLELESFAEEMAQFNEQHPADPDYVRKAFEQRLRDDLENGLLDQSTYDEQLAQSREYAKILIE